MAHFYLYLANIVFVLTLLGLFVYLAGRVALQDGRGLLGQSLRSIGGAFLRTVIRWPVAAVTPHARHLVVLEVASGAGIEAGHKYPLQAPVTKIGRGAHNHITLRDPRVSSDHLMLSYEKGAWLVEDLHSSNGTILYPRDGSSKEVQDKPESLQIGDVLELGDTRLRLEA